LIALSAATVADMVSFALVMVGHVSSFFVLRLVEKDEKKGANDAGIADLYDSS